mmetsp:Transcript_11741/g.37320  ORF Transcript_11741/g.37320 Transcript_11741/m.37320 type:complete len:95 (-) Transcript_11741:160-444(-)
MTGLERLSLHSCSAVSSEGIRHLMALPRLHKLVLARCTGLTDSLVGLLATATGLGKLDLSGSNLPFEVVGQIAQANPKMELTFHDIRISRGLSL